jgi:hypothetical protein
LSLWRDEEEYGEHRRLGRDGRGVPAREGELALECPVEEGLEQRVVKCRGHGDSGHGEHRAVESPRDQAADRAGGADRDGRDGRRRPREPDQEAVVVAEGRDDRRVDGVVEPVGPRLPPE